MGAIARPAGAARSQEKPERPASVQSARSKIASGPVAPSAGAAASAPAVAKATQKYADATWYTGVVKWWRGSWGLLSCEALRASFPEQDIFLHKSDCAAGAPRQWDRMQFRLVIDGGNPKAVRAKPEEDKKMSYEEWRASRRQA